ncbi:MAG: hypothetical protein CW716_09115 [Candidatus Bathyarchaeum sp.]|nr:MAG: hypothetical protein CW716_09115 [Candidatus Bathyarchaeum sp.]
MNKEDWRMVLFLLLSHHMPEKLHRTIHLNIGGKNIYLCARCTGDYSGTLTILVAWFLGLKLPTWLYLPLVAILPLATVIDWLTQSCKLRESRNTLRVTTGFPLGIAKGLILLMLVQGWFNLFLQALVIVGLYVLVVSLVAWKTKFVYSYFD